MIVLYLVLLLVGVFLSALFSGSETGFYRASRVRLVIDNLEGNATASRLLWLMNNPGLFVATTLVGNNVANYLTSMAIVLVTIEIWNSPMAEMLMPVLLSPLLFVYGELLPKNLFFQAPNILLRKSAPMFLLFTYMFVPATAVLWAMSKLLERLLGQAPERVQLTLARQELHQVIDDGIQAGILQPVQRTLAQNFSLVAVTPVREVCTPLARVVAMPANSSRGQIMKVASRKEIPEVLMFEGTRRKLVGYVRVVEMLIEPERIKDAPRLHPLQTIEASEPFGEALLRMQALRQTLLRVIEIDGNKEVKTVGVLSMDQLTDPLLKGPLVSLRR